MQQPSTSAPNLCFEPWVLQPLCGSAENPTCDQPNSSVGQQQGCSFAPGRGSKLTSDMSHQQLHACMPMSAHVCKEGILCRQRTLCTRPRGDWCVSPATKPGMVGTRGPCSAARPHLPVAATGQTTQGSPTCLSPSRNMTLEHNRTHGHSCGLQRACNQRSSNATRVQADVRTRAAADMQATPGLLDGLPPTSLPAVGYCFTAAASCNGTLTLAPAIARQLRRQRGQRHTSTDCTCCSAATTQTP